MVPRLNQGNARVAVVGGGIAGICAAANLAERGISVTLLERNPVSFGGRVCASPATTVCWDGRRDVFPMEHGLHGWWRQYRNFLSFMERHDLLGTLVPAYDQTLIYRDAKHTYRANVGRRTQVTRVPEPFHHLPLLADPSFRRLLAGREMAKLPKLVKRVAEILAFDPYAERSLERYDAQSVKDFLPGMPIIFQAFLRSLTRSGFFSDPPEVSLWAFLLSLQLYVFLRKEDQCFHFMRGQVASSFCEPMLRFVRGHGAQTVSGVTVERIEPRPVEGGWRLSWRASDGARSIDGDTRDAPFSAPSGTFDIDMLVLATDVAGTQSLAGRSPSIRDSVGDLSVFRGRPSTNVRLWWRKSPDTTYAESGVFAGRFSADNFFWLHRIHDRFAAWHEETGAAASECHIYAPESLHEKSDEELLSRVEQDMEAGFPEIAGSCIHRAIVRNPPTHISFPVGSAAHFPPVRTAYENLVLAGDWVDGGAPVLYMERACQTGICAANVLLERLGLRPFEVLHPERAGGHMRLIQRVLRGGRRSKNPE